MKSRILGSTFRATSALVGTLACIGTGATVQAQESSETVADDRVIVVTAQKRETLIQETPLAITALDSEALDQAGVLEASGLTALIPNVTVRPFNNAIIVATRGISNENTSNLGDASLAFHVNGIYVGRPRAASALFYDVERVEFLRGPQGTLYGRNSTAGALNIITRRPELDDFGAGGDFLYGNFDTVVARGYLNAPVSDQVGLRAAVYYGKHDGYAINNQPVPPLPGPPNVVGPINEANETITPTIENGDDDDEISARLSALFEPTDTLSILLVGQYSNTDEVGQVRSIIDTPNYVLTGGPQAGQLFLPQAQDPDDPRVYSLNSQPFYEIENYDITAEATWEVSDDIAITWLSGFRKDENALATDAAGTENLSVVNASGEAEQWSTELRVYSTGDGPFQWLIGGLYFDEDQFDELFINNVGGGPANVVAENLSISNASYAVFGEASYQITERLALILGGRFSYDKKTREGYQVAGPGLVGRPDPIPEAALLVNDEDWNRFNWKAGFDYKISDDVLFYATASTGYRAGGFNASSEEVYDPEDILAFEAGLKTQLLDRRLTFNLAAFYYDYEDLQVTSPREVDGRIQAFTDNAAEAEIYGFEIEAFARPSDWLTIDLSFGYLSTEFGEFLSIDNICTSAGLTVPVQFRPGCVTEQRFNPDGSPVIVDPDGPGPQPAGPVFDLQQVNYAGNELANAPDITLNLGANLTLFDNDAGTVVLRGAVRLVGDSFLSEYNRSPDRVESYSQTEARITYRSPDRRYLVEGFIRNIEDNAIPGSVSVTASGFGVSYLPPRTYGVRLGFEF